MFSRGSFAGSPLGGEIVQLPVAEMNLLFKKTTTDKQTTTTHIRHGCTCFSGVCCTKADNEAGSCFE